MTRIGGSHPNGSAPSLTRRALGRRRALGTGAALSFAVASIAGVVDAGAAAASTAGTVNLVAYSTPAPAYAALIKAFNKTKSGGDVTVSQSYGPSGSQAKNVAAGQPADVVNFSQATDMISLVPKVVAPNWGRQPEHQRHRHRLGGLFVVPKGNPKHITTWADLLKPGTRVFTPNPFSSGSARWNITAAYCSQLKLGECAAEAQSYVQQLLENTVVQGASAALELQDFLADEGAHKGDVMLDYESDAIQARRAGQPISYVVPEQTILIENPIAVTTDTSNPTAAKAFLNYLLSIDGQKEWARLGSRPVLPSVASWARKENLFPHSAQLFTILSLGGWSEVATEFFATTPGSLRFITKIEQNLGQPTSK